jgi:hypothetical protein
MDLPIPKNENPQMTVPTLPNMPVLPSLFTSMLPTPVPQLIYKPGILPLLDGFIHNWKLGQLQRAAEREAAISEAKLRQTRAQFAQIEELLLFGPRYALAMDKLTHEKEMLHVTKQTAEAFLAHIQVQTYMAQIEAQKSQLELQHMMKELGGGNGNGDRK